jgi:hypothetical protein
MSDDPNISIADRLYGPRATAPSTTADDPAATGTEQIERTLYPARPPLEAPAEGEGLYGTTTALAGMFKKDLEAIGDTCGLSVQDQAVERMQFTEFVRTSGLDVSAARTLHDVFTAARIGYTRAGADEAADKAVVAQKRADAETVRRDTRERWGAQTAQELLQAQAKFVQQQPLLAETLRTWGLEWNPVVVNVLIEHVWRNGYR